MTNRYKQAITRLDDTHLGYTDYNEPSRDAIAHLEFDQPESNQSRRYRETQHEKAHRNQTTLRRPI